MRTSPTHLPVRLAIFDLDGTLADTVADIAAATNRVLEAAGLATHPLAAFDHFVGSGVSALIERAAPAQTASEHATLERQFRVDYAAHLVVETALFPGVVAMLERVQGAGVATAVLSNKPHALTARVIDALLPNFADRWVAVLGQRDGVAKKPDPRAFVEICNLADTDPIDAAMIGDTPIDIATARGVGARALGVGWGFRDSAALVSAGADSIATTAAELGDQILTPQ